MDIPFVMHLLTFLSFVHWWSKNWTVDFCIKFLCWNSPCVLQAVVQAFTFIPTAMQSNFWVHFSQVLFVWCDFFGLVGLVYQAWKNVLCEWSKSRKRCYVNTAGETKTSGTEISLWVAVLSNLSHQKTKQMGDSVCCYPPPADWHAHLLPLSLQLDPETTLETTVAAAAAQNMMNSLPS